MSDKQTVKFGDICREVKITTKDPIADGYERYIGLEHLDSGSLKIKRWGMITEDNPSFTRVFKKGHILFGKRRPYLKKAAIAEFDGICSGDIIVMEPKANFDRDLLAHIVQSNIFWMTAINTSSGSLSPRTKFKSIAEFSTTKSSLNTLAEKKNILSSSENINNYAREAISSGENLLPLLMQELLYGCKTDEPKRQANCGLIPESWDEVRFDLVGKFLSGGTPSKSKSEYWGGSIPWFSPKDMKTVNLSESIDTITDEGAKLGSKIISKNTILFVVRGMILAHTFPVGITNVTSAFNQDMKAIEVDEDFCPRFVLNWLIASSPKFLSSVSTSTHGTKRLSSDSFSTFWVPKPPKHLQEKIALILDGYRELLNTIRSKEEIANSIRQEIVGNYLG